MSIQVVKRNGNHELLDISKLHKVTEYACRNLYGVSYSDLELHSQIQFYNGIKTNDIQEVLIKTAADMITEETPNYQFVAGRLVNYHLRKQIYGQYEPPALFDHVKKVIEYGFYDPELLNYYSSEEWNEINSFIDHSRDDDLTYVAMEQFRGKYLVKNRVTGQIFETPQMVYILIAAVFFHDYSIETRMQYVKEYYDLISTHVISLPTPVMSGVRTPVRQYSSCVLIDIDDNLDSIVASTGAIVKYVSKRAGIGVNVGRIRCEGSVIRNGDAIHTGLIPYLKLIQAATKSCSQGGVRGGSTTVNFPIWRLDIEDLIVLKNNKGTEESRVRHLDYCIQLNKLFYERLMQGGNITLFSPNEVPGLYEAFFKDQKLFKEIYERAERNTRIRKKVVKATDLFSKIMTERKETGRIYLMNVDHSNEHSSFLEQETAIYQTNLCVEVLLSTSPIQSLEDTENTIALCILSGINLGKIKSPSDFQRPCEMAVRGLNQLIDMQEYLLPASANSAKKARPLGIGVINLAYWLAKNNIKYDGVTQEDLQKIHEYFEAFSYYLIKASNDIAKEKGACELSHQTKYHYGICPIDTYKKDVDELAKPIYHMNWIQLKKDLEKYGTMNSTLMAQFPAETSSQICNGTNGIEAVRALVSSKQSKDGILKQVVPEIRRLGKKYDLLWNQKSPEGYLKIAAVIQKFYDQSLSVNTSYNPKFYPNNEISMSEMIKHLLLAYKWGLKTLYYFNTAEIVAETPEVKEEECEACRL